jgi:hypothetical protein
MTVRGAALRGEFIDGVAGRSETLLRGRVVPPGYILSCTVITSPGLCKIFELGLIVQMSFELLFPLWLAGDGDWQVLRRSGGKPLL